MKKTQSKKTTGAGVAPAAGSVADGGIPKGGDPAIVTGGDGDDTGSETPAENNNATTTTEAPSDGGENLEAKEGHTATVLSITEEVVIVVCGTSDALPLLSKAWEQKAAPATIHSMNTDGMSFEEIIENLIADDGLPDIFVLVPANCFPTHRVSLADLVSHKVRVMKNGDRVATTGLPVMIDTAVAIKAMEQLSEQDTFSEEEFMATYNAIAHADELPFEVGQGIEGSVCYVLRADPSLSVVKEALSRRKFIHANAEGFPPIANLLTELYE
jgi:hypothetical protein